MRTTVTITFSTAEILPQAAKTRLWEYGRLRQFAGQAKKYELHALDREHTSPAEVIAYYIGNVQEIVLAGGSMFREITVKVEVRE